ncbi:MAG: KpsF/GutQ family sugar-phosphate isomerase, partial [Lysobacterales bacterium]
RRAGRRTLEIEARALTDLKGRINAEFVRACGLLYRCKGRIVVTGMGKSGHIGGKIAATFASTGSPAFFVHPGEASHGDLGMITDQDVVLALSNSGETPEVLVLLPLLKRMAVPLIALTGKAKSTLARAADVHLDVSVAKEACPLDLAPTSSTTAALAMGDALAVALLEAREFTAEDFARAHPGGALGKRLLLRLTDLMHTGRRVPKVRASTRLLDALDEMSVKGLGMTVIVDSGNKLVGVFTDGDLRRTLDRGLDVRKTTIEAVMTRKPRAGRSDMLAAEALQLMDKHKINALPVVDSSNRVVGAFNMHDLLRAGVV